MLPWSSCTNTSEIKCCTCLCALRTLHACTKSMRLQSDAIKCSKINDLTHKSAYCDTALQIGDVASMVAGTHILCNIHDKWMFQRLLHSCVVTDLNGFADALCSFDADLSSGPTSPTTTFTPTLLACQGLSVHVLPKKR